MKKYNFSPGPAAIPQEVLLRAQKHLADYHGYALSLLELSHRGKVYHEVHSHCINLLTKLLEIPNTHQVLLLAGGATLQFAMAPMNLLHGQNRKVSIALTGAWATKAHQDLQQLNAQINVVFDGKPLHYSKLPNTLTVAEDSVYLHLCSNETIHGVQWKHFPQVQCPIVADMSSDILSRPINWKQFGIVYAGTQKNLGPSGLCIIVIRKNLLPSCNPNLPAYLRYPLHAQNNSLYNTPPSFAVYMVMLQLEWLQKFGSILKIQQQNQQKATKLYECIDSSNGFYRNPVEKNFRSDMNVPFLLPNPSLEEKFLQESIEHGMEGLKGHRSLGGMRASIYNAVEPEAVDSLIDFMAKFQTKYS